MALNKKKLLKNAQKYTKKGAWDAAIEEYKKLLVENPKDRNLHNTVGDLYAKKGDNKLAIEEYKLAAKSFEEDGFIPQTIALYRKILRIDNALVEIYSKLAQLYSEQGLTREAISQHKIVADFYTKKGVLKKALDTYKQIADLDPSNLKVRIRLGELYNKEGLHNEAVAEYLTIADMLNKKGAVEESFHLLQKVIEIDPNNVDAQKGLAKIYISKGVFDKAVNSLEIILTHEGDNLQSLFLIGKAYFKAGNYDQAQAAFEKILSLDPSQIGVRENLGRVYLQRGEFDNALVQFDQVIDNFIQKKEYELAKNLLNRLIQFKPDYIRTRERQIEICEKMGDETRVLEEYKALAQIAVNNHELERALNIYDNLAQKYPSDPEIRNKFETLKSQVKAETPMESVDAFQSEIERELDDISVDDLMEGVEVDSEEEFDAPLAAAELGVEMVNEYQPQKNRDSEDDIDISIDDSIAAAETFDDDVMDIPVEISDEVVPIDSKELKASRRPPSSKVDAANEFADIIEPETTDDDLTLEIDEVQSDMESLVNDDFDAESDGEMVVEVDSESDSAPDIEMALDGDREMIKEQPAVDEEELAVQEPQEELTDEKIIEDHLYHSEVYIKYGMTDKALDHLLSIVKLKSDHLEAHLKIFTIYKEKGNQAKAADEAYSLAMLLEEKGNTEGATKFYRELAQLNPAHPAIKVKLPSEPDSKSVQLKKEEVRKDKIEVHPPEIMPVREETKQPKGETPLKTQFPVKEDSRKIKDDVRLTEEIRKPRSESPLKTEQPARDGARKTKEVIWLKDEINKIKVDAAAGGATPPKVEIRKPDIKASVDAVTLDEDTPKSRDHDVSLTTVKSPTDHELPDEKKMVESPVADTAGPAALPLEAAEPVQKKKSSFDLALDHFASEDFKKPPVRPKSVTTTKDIADLDKLTMKKDRVKITTQSFDKLDLLAASAMKGAKKTKEKPKVSLDDLESSLMAGKKRRSTGFTPTPPLNIDMLALSGKKKTPPKTLTPETAERDPLKLEKQLSQASKKLDALDDLLGQRPSRTTVKPREKPAAPDFSQDLDEAEYYLQQGFLAEAKKIFESILMRNPSNINAKLKLAALEKMEIETPSVEEIADDSAGLETIESENPIVHHGELAGEMKESPAGRDELAEIEDEAGTDEIEDEVEDELEEEEIEDEEDENEDEGEVEEDTSIEKTVEAVGPVLSESEDSFDLESDSVAPKIRERDKAVKEVISPAESEESAGMLDFGLGDEMAGKRSSAFDDEGQDFFDLSGDSAEESTDILKSELALDDKSTEHSLQDLFEEFKKGVDEQVSSEDYETHYNLGIAYKEMGLIDEAISEFEKAARDRSMFLQCRSMIGLCHMENQNYDLAVAEFRRGVETPGFTSEEYLGLQYDMGLALELLGDKEKAFDSFQYVYNLDSKFREVSQKIKELRKYAKPKGSDNKTPGPRGNVSYV